MPDRSTVRQQIQPLAVSALFDSPEAVDRAVERLLAAGVPRDLIEVVVSPAAAQRFYGRVARPPGLSPYRYAGIGGLAGLVIGSVVGLAVAGWPGFQSPGPLALVQLLGPNLATVTGATIGAIFGAFRHRKPDPRHRRAAESPEAIVVVVTSSGDEKTQGLLDLLTEVGGRAPRREPRRDGPGSTTAARVVEG